VKHILNNPRIDFGIGINSHSSWIGAVSEAQKGPRLTCQLRSSGETSGRYDCCAFKCRTADIDPTHTYPRLYWTLPGHLLLAARYHTFPPQMMATGNPSTQPALKVFVPGPTLSINTAPPFRIGECILVRIPVPLQVDERLDVDPETPASGLPPTSNGRSPLHFAFICSIE
jgi:hypothetical protein